MKGAGQRQDVTFFALAVVVLVVAVALFIGMKSIPRAETGAAEDDGAAAGLSEEPAGEVDAEASGQRDPFRSPMTRGGAAPTQPQGDLKLVGVVTGAGDGPRAVIHSGKRRYFAKVGDRAAGYTVVSIGSDSAVLEEGGNRITLVLRNPETEE